MYSCCGTFTNTFQTEIKSGVHTQFSRHWQAAEASLEQAARKTHVADALCSRPSVDLARELKWEKAFLQQIRTRGYDEARASPWSEATYF